jgi:23S rRNA (uridine2552-2'-O)-methyltransferase
MTGSHDKKGGSGRSYRGNAGLTNKVQKKRGLSASSRRWIERQINDPFVAEARSRGFRSRAALKLEQINSKYQLFKKGQTVLDLGSAPGGWLQIVSDIVGLDQGKGRLAGIDLLDVEPVAGALILKGDINDDEKLDELIAYIGGKADWVISDMAADTTGHRTTDHIRTTALLEMALDVAMRVLVPGGGFLAKCFQGGTEKTTLTTLRQSFQQVRHVKPDASRTESVEIYVLATGFKGVPDDYLMLEH